MLGVEQALELGQSSQAWMEDRGSEFRFRGRSHVLEASFKVENVHFPVRLVTLSGRPPRPRTVAQTDGTWGSK